MMSTIFVTSLDAFRTDGTPVNTVALGALRKDLKSLNSVMPRVATVA